MSHFVGMAGQFLSPFDFKSPEIGNQIFRFAVNLLPQKRDVIRSFPRGHADDSCTHQIVMHPRVCIGQGRNYGLL